MIPYVRVALAIMLCIANMIIYGLKVNIATAIIGMTKREVFSEGGNQTKVQCPNFVDAKSEAAAIEGPFKWDSIEQSYVVGVYFIGYMVGMFPSGYCADRFNTKWVLLITVFFNAIATILVPVTAKLKHPHGLHALYALRFLTGLVSASNLPVVNVLIGKWVVYEEKSMWVAIIYAGTSLGTVISILTSGMIMSELGWEAVFYIHGTLPLIWCVVFLFFFADNPESQKLISEEEREYICNAYGHRKPFATSKPKVPWRAILTSIPFWALVITNTLGNFAWYFLLTTVPKYMHNILLYDIKSNSGITCTPYLISALFNTCLGKLSDWGRKRGFFGMTVTRKIAVTISCVPTSALILIIAYIGCHRAAVTSLLCTSIVIAGVIFIGHLCNQNDLAPNFAGILMGITNTPGTISAFVLPALTGYFTDKAHTFAAWRNVFWITVIAQMLAWVIFMIFGSGEIQPWNEPKQTTDNDEPTASDRQRNTAPQTT